MITDTTAHYRIQHNGDFSGSVAFQSLDGKQAPFEIPFEDLLDVVGMYLVRRRVESAENTFYRDAVHGDWKKE